MWVSVDLGGRGEDVDGIVFPGYLEGVSRSISAREECVYRVGSIVFW